MWKYNLQSVHNNWLVNATGATCRAGITYPFGAPEFLVGLMLLDL